MFKKQICSKKDRFSRPSRVKVAPLGVKKMDASTQRRIEIASSWASNRITVLDTNERFEDSYAITQEFREWIICLNQHPEQLENSLLKFPRSFVDAYSHKEKVDKDELLEL